MKTSDAVVTHCIASPRADRARANRVELSEFGRNLGAILFHVDKALSGYKRFPRSNSLVKERLASSRGAEQISSAFDCAIESSFSSNDLFTHRSLLSSLNETRRGVSICSAFPA